jgi:hypothetical protein
MHIGKAFLAVLSLLFAASFLIFHVFFPLLLPLPLGDESWFAISAISFSEGASFSADRALIHEIYWMPPGIYVFQGAVMFLTGNHALGALRATSFLCVVAAALVFHAISTTTLETSKKDHRLLAGALTLAWAFNLYVTRAADIMRPEGLSLLVSFSALYCLLRGRLAGAAGFTTLALLTHPLLAAPALLSFASVIPAFRLATLRAERPKSWEWLILVLAVGLLAWEATRFLLDTQTYLAHWRFQLQLKMKNPLGRRAALSGALTAIVFLFACGRAFRRDAGFFAHPDTHCILLAIFGLTAFYVHFFPPASLYTPYAITGLFFLVLALVTALSNRARFDRLASAPKWASFFVVACALASWADRHQLSAFAKGSLLNPELPGPRSPPGPFPVDKARQMLLDGKPHRVLVEPRIYYAFLSDRRPEGLDAWTWTPFSSTANIDFDRAVVLARTYLEWEDPPWRTGQLRGFVCAKRTEIPERPGGPVVELLEVARNSSAPEAPFRLCE